MMSLVFKRPTAIAQRDGLRDALIKRGAEHPNLVVLSSDASRSTRAIRFKKAYPGRFICTGISEQNTLGMAAGLSTAGWMSLVTGRAIFVVGKAWQPMRNSIAYLGLNQEGQ